MNDYNSWTDIPAAVLQCDFILSSSLHGLIVSDSYKIPNVWIKLSNKVGGKGFKYRDYLLSVGKKNLKPVIISEDMDLDDICRLRQFSESPDIDLRPLIQSCPFIDDNRKSQLIEKLK